MENHSRIVCNQHEKFQCSDDHRLTSSGYQLVGDGEIRFVCKDCFLKYRNQYPVRGMAIKKLLDPEEAFSDSYNPDGQPEQTEETGGGSGYIGELVPDGNGGWREPTQAELDAMNAEPVQPERPAPARDGGGFSTMEIKYRFTTDNKLQVILPKRCKIGGDVYELVVVTQENE